MSGAEVTDPGVIVGFLEPYPWVGVGTPGVDFTESGTVWATTRGTSTPAPRVALVPASTDAASGDELFVTALSGGAPAGLAYRIGSGGAWMGTDSPLYLTGYQSIAPAPIRSPSMHVREDGSVVVLTAVGGGDFSLATRSTAGAWSFATIYTQTTTATTAGCCLVAMASGDVWAYLAVESAGAATFVIRSYLSRDDGVTWELQSSRAATITGSGTPIHMCGAPLPGGRVVLWVTSRDGGGVEYVTQYWSADGGYHIAQVSGEISNYAAWSALTVGASTYVLGEGVNHAYIWTVGDPATATLSGTGVELVSTTAPRRTAGGAMWLGEDGSPRAWLPRHSGNVDSYITTDGLTWALEGSVSGPWTGGSGDAPALPVVAQVRGIVLAVMTSWDLSTVDGVEAYELRFGARASFTASIRPFEGDNGPAFTFVPLATMADQGWAATDTGTPGLALTASGGQVISCGAGDTAQRSAPLQAIAPSVVGWVVTKATSGTLSWTLRCGGHAVRIDVTTTTIGAADASGGAANSVSHAGGWLDIVAVVDPSGHGSVYWRDYDQAEGRVYTLLRSLGTLGSMGGAASYWRWNIGAGESGATLAASATGLGSLHPYAEGFTAPDDLRPVSTLGAAQGYIGGGAWLRQVGGLARAGDSWLIGTRGAYPGVDALPSVLRTPRRGWRSSTAPSDEVLRLLLDPDSGDPCPERSQVWGLYLAGLESVPLLDIELDGVGSTYDLRVAVEYTHNGNAVQLIAPDAPQVQWVEHDEFAGGMFEFENGDVRKIISNTAGTIGTSPSTSTLFPTMILDEGSSSASGAGYIWPAKALILLDRAGATSLGEVTLTIEAATPIHADDYRGIGVIACGPVRVLGAGVDRTMSDESAPGDRLVDLDDGQRVRIERAPARRRVEVGIVDSHRDIRQARTLALRTGLAPDFIVASNDAGALPAAERYADPLVVASLLRRIGRKPIVFLPNIPVFDGDSSGVVYNHTRAMGALYGSIVNEPRAEQIQIGRTLESDGVRLTTIAIEEEL